MKSAFSYLLINYIIVLIIRTLEVSHFMHYVNSRLTFIYAVG